uniref:Uncharacterized protein n=1 Tax=Triticum urartu TaxID=4572 RepID=A0A8R7UPL9_TRIUA
SLLAPPPPLRGRFSAPRIRRRGVPRRGLRPHPSPGTQGLGEALPPQAPLQARRRPRLPRGPRPLRRRHRHRRRQGPAVALRHSRIVSANPEHVRAMVVRAQGLGVPRGSGMFREALDVVASLREET